MHTEIRGTNLASVPRFPAEQATVADGGEGSTLTVSGLGHSCELWVISVKIPRQHSPAVLRLIRRPTRQVKLISTVASVSQYVIFSEARRGGLRALVGPDSHSPRADAPRKEVRDDRCDVARPSDALGR